MIPRALEILIAAMIPFDAAQRTSATFGILLIVLVQIHKDEIIRTIVLAGIGGTSVTSSPLA